MKVQVLFIGKPRSRPLNDAAQEYAKRLGRFCRFELTEIKGEADAQALTKPLRVAIDPRGQHLSSEAFAKLLETAGRDVAFFVGGAEGFSPGFRKQADRVVALSKMTMPHELARLVLVEQLYRAFTILRGHPYPK